MDLDDLAQKRPAVSSAAFKARVQAVLRSKKAQTVAAKCARGLRKVAQKVVLKKGAASGS